MRGGGRCGSFPALVVCTLLTAFVRAPVAAGREGGTYSGASAWRFSWSQILLRNKVWGIDGTLTQVPEAGNWNGSTWTLQHELLAYVAVLVLGLGSITWKNWTTNNDISYGVYIYAFPVGQMLVVFGSASLGLIPNIAMTTAGTAILAWLSWHIIERPALRLKRLVVSGRTPQHRLRQQPGVGS